MLGAPQHASCMNYPWSAANEMGSIVAVWPRLGVCVDQLVNLARTLWCTIICAERQRRIHRVGRVRDKRDCQGKLTRNGARPSYQFVLLFPRLSCSALGFMLCIAQTSGFVCLY